jgi:hypothetical protein
VDPAVRARDWRRRHVPPLLRVRGVDGKLSFAIHRTKRLSARLPRTSSRRRPRVALRSASTTSASSPPTGCS